MRKIAIAFVSTLLFLLCFSPSYSQVTNFMVNGSATNFTMTSGDVVSWNFNIPAGATATGELWIDLNSNHAIDPGTDRLLFIFSETDGDTTGQDGPPDMDGTVNGSVELMIAIGLAPQNYVLRFSNNGVGQSVWGTVDPLASPAYTISGTVSGPAGADLGYIVIEASSTGGSSVEFWHGLTDSAGHYTIEMNSDTSGNPWIVRFNEVPPPYSVSPRDTFLTIAGSFTGIDFQLIAAAAQVTGYVVDDAGDSLASVELYIARNDSGISSYYHYYRTDPDGRFWFGIPLDELDGHTWRIVMPYSDMPITTHMLGSAQTPVLGDGDSVHIDVVSYLVNSSIQGRVRVNGLDPGFPVRIFASTPDSGESFTMSDSATGSFSIPVTDKLSSYMVQVFDNFGPYQFPTIMAQAGDTGIIYNITTTGIDDGPGELPRGYDLGQNYPNPFNPVTTIPYSIPTRGQVVLTVYDILGREVATLVNEIQEPGAKLVSFDAAELPSGVYSYRISSGSFSQARKMLILK